MFLSLPMLPFQPAVQKFSIKGHSCAMLPINHNQKQLLTLHSTPTQSILDCAFSQLSLTQHTSAATSMCSSRHQLAHAALDCGCDLSHGRDADSCDGAHRHGAQQGVHNPTDDLNTGPDIQLGCRVHTKTMIHSQTGSRLDLSHFTKPHNEATRLLPQVST